MAGPSIMVRVLGDVKGLSDSFKDTSAKAESAGSKIHGAFQSVLGTLNKTGVLGPFGETLATIDEAIQGVAEHGKDIGKVMLGIGGSLVGVGVGLQALGSKDKAAHQQLQAAVEATGASYDDYEGKVEEAIKSQEKFGTTANQTQDALTSLTQATHSPAKALDLLSTAANLAAARHESLTTAADQLGKVYNGNTKLLKPFGIELDKATGKTKDGKTAMEALAAVTAGQASAATDTFAGKLDAMKAKLEDSASVFAQKYGPAITAVGAGMTGLGAAVEVTSGIVKAFQAVELADIPIELAMLAPILLIIAALAALGVAAYLIYRNWNTIWNGMKVAVQAVWTWIKANWPLLLGVLLGPFALAAAAIYKYHDQILAALKAIWAWITTTWATLTGYIEAPFKAASTWIVGAMNTLIGFIAGLPARITQISAGMFHGMWEAFRSMVNGIIDIWNGLHFTLPKINEGPIHIGGETIGVPRIPHLAQGGLITQSGIAMVHQGETVTPAGKRTGPAVVLQNAVFNSGVDIDLFMRKAAWVAQTARI